MKTNPETPAVETKSSHTRTIKIIGVGGAGVSLLDTLDGGEFAGAGLVAINTDGPSLAASAATVKIHLETKLLRGLGTGGDAERGGQVQILFPFRIPHVNAARAVPDDRPRAVRLRENDVA